MNRVRRVILFGKLQCSKCKQWLPVAQFSPDKRAHCGYASRCKTCLAEDRVESGEFDKRRQRYQADPDYRERQIGYTRKYQQKVKESS